MMHISQYMYYSKPFTCFTFTIDVVVTKKIVAIVASNFISWGHVLQHLNTGSVAASSYKLHTFRKTKDHNSTYMYKIRATSI